MKSKFYQPGEERAKRVHDLFRTIARRYDRLNDLMSLGLHRRWKNRLVQFAGNPERVLDLCCGTGDIANRSGGRVIGLDFTQEMLQVARTRNPRIPWIRADALRLPFPDATFDAVTVGYGLRNLADLETGLGEIRRVLQPGGRFLSLDFGKPRSAAWRTLYFAYLRLTVPIMGKLFCGDRDAYAYLPRSTVHLPAQPDLYALLRRAGFTRLRKLGLLLGSAQIVTGVRA